MKSTHSNQWLDREMDIWEEVSGDRNVERTRWIIKESAAIFSCSKTPLSLNQNPTQEEHLSSLIKDQPALY